MLLNNLIRYIYNYLTKQFLEFSCIFYTVGIK